MKVMLLAAGEGRRLQPYTLEKPKPAIPFLTAPLASFSLALLEKIPVDMIVVNTHHLAQQIENLFHWTKLPGGLSNKNVKFSSEKDHLLGSGGGIHKAKSYLDGYEPFLVMNADEVILPKNWGLLEGMLEYHRWNKSLATLLTMDHPGVGTQFGGAWTEPGKTLVKTFSKTKPTAGLVGHHFVGVMILEPRVFKYFKERVGIEVEVENILYETLTKAMSAGEEVHVYQTQCEWFETGNPQDFLKAARICVDAIEAENGEPWVQFLAQTLRVYGEGRLLIEREQPELVSQIRKVFQASLIRIEA